MDRRQAEREVVLESLTLPAPIEMTSNCAAAI